MIVLTVDQRGSRRAPDRVDAMLAALRELRPRPLRAFQRTAGDEFQGVVDDVALAVDVVLRLVRDREWHVGIGVGEVEHPLPRSTRAGRGPAFAHARAAAERAKRRPLHVAVVGADPARAADAETVLSLLATLLERRSDAAWEAIDLVRGGHTLEEAAARLGVTRQAVGQRLATAQWQLEQDARPLAVRMLEEAGA